METLSDAMREESTRRQMKDDWCAIILVDETTQLIPGAVMEARVPQEGRLAYAGTFWQWGMAACAR